MTGQSINPRRDIRQGEPCALTMEKKKKKAVTVQTPKKKYIYTLNSKCKYSLAGISTTLHKTRGCILRTYITNPNPKQKK